jgi:IclR family transcriptional regulator, KDG regulon repressor
MPGACRQVTRRSTVAPKQATAERAAICQVRVLDRALDILEAFTLRQKELSIREIVEATGLNRTTVIRLVGNLERRRMLQQEPSTGGYRLGRRLFEMGGIVCSSFSLVEAAAGALSALEQQSGATIVLAVRNGDHSVTVDRRQGVGDRFAMLPMLSEVGTVRPLTYGPVGQVFLATLAPEAVDDLLDRYPLEQYTPYSIVDRDRFLERLPCVRSEGYAIEVNELVEGLMGVAAPILDFAGKTAGALALGFPAARGAEEAFLDSAIRGLKQAAGEASANMGFAGNAHAAAGFEKSVDQAAE